MASQSIELTVGSLDIQVEVGDNNIEVVTTGPTINVQLNSVGIVTSISADGKFYLDGEGGDTYFTYNSSSGRVELWVDGTREGEWGPVTGGSPFN